MTHFSARFVGQPVGVAPDNALVSYNKWTLVDDLTAAAADFDLSPRTIMVLRLMLTFVPDTDLPALPGRAVIFASNATLSNRLGGMPESTLRRHLSKLVSAGLIARNDSPNGKRFVKRLGGGIACAYGFDMAPLAMMAEEISALAHQQRQRAEEHAILRTRILSARHTLTTRLIASDIDPDGAHEHSPLYARARLLLRRKDNNQELATLLQDFETALSAPEMSVTNSQNERHQHKKKNINSDKEADPALPTLLGAFKEYHRMFPETACSWLEVSHQAHHLVPMMGIDLPVYEEAKRVMGSRTAPIVILGILERFETIENHGGYLRHLTKQAASGSFDLMAFVRGS